MTMNYREQNFEDHISRHLLNSGYHQCQSSDYDKDLCLIPSELIEFIKTSQPKEFEKLELQYGEDTAKRLMQRIEKEIDTRGPNTRRHFNRWWHFREAYSTATPRKNIQR